MQDAYMEQSIMQIIIIHLTAQFYSTERDVVKPEKNHDSHLHCNA